MNSVDAIKPAVIFPVRASGPNKFRWRWRAAECKDESAGTFLYFYDCVEDARARGYRCTIKDTKLGPNGGTARPGSP